MSIKKQIPNIITLLNLLSGTIAVMMAVEGKLVLAGIFVLIGIFFDFFDGLVARLLNVQSELGKQLDSLADMVTSGVVPGIVMYQLLRQTSDVWNNDTIPSTSLFMEGLSYLPLIGLIITLAAAYRLANFNIDSRQSTSFIGLPTPAMALFVLSLPLILNYENSNLVTNLIYNKWFLIAVTLIGSYLMNANLPLFSLKFKDYSLKNNTIKYLFIILSIILIIALKFVAIPVIIILYVVFSLIENVLKKS
ncbi:CDP-alcohol phosphatidyltransferase family protein [Urechidicola croceus]|uniref:Phosphatidylserine synthase n=1 Tax=Urechidicola croceus TaxID=1850246 RepID=A0A1D8P4N7_9FLAO|nr:CDP-alcohol phosphatidyltransferase family protein [Urechidicola croceus]AOW19524.1 phosphatidylserine synthase [Urechidicola croceus]